MLKAFNSGALVYTRWGDKSWAGWAVSRCWAECLHELQCGCKYFQAQTDRWNRKNPNKFLGCQYCHKVSMQNEVVWQSVSLVIWLQMKLSLAIKFHAWVSALCIHQSASDISRIFSAVLVNMLAEICETLLFPSISVHGFFSPYL